MNQTNVSQSDSSFDPFDEATPDDKVELRALKQALQLSGGFRLIFARCNVLPYRQRLIARLQSELPALNIQLIHFDRPIKHLLDEMRPHLADPLPDAVFVTGLESSIAESSVEDRSRFIANLNAARNSFSRVIPRPLVLWVTEKTLAAIFTGAPDFFSIRAGVYFFVAAPESADEIASSLTDETAQQIDSLMRAEKQDRIAAIRSLLADYESQPAGKRDLESEMHLNLQLGLLFDARGAADEARISYERSLAIARQLGDKHNEGVILGNLGNAYAALGEVRRAIEQYEQALEIAREIGDRRGEGNRLTNLGDAYQKLGDAKQAIDYYEQVLTIDREIEDKSGEAIDLGSIGDVYLDSGDAKRAIEYYDLALNASRRASDQELEAEQLERLSRACNELGDRDRAIANAESALEICERIDPEQAKAVRERLSEWRIQTGKKAG